MPRQPIRITRLLAAVFAFAATSAFAATPVYVVGTLYKRHADAPAYDLAALAGMIDKIAPEVLVLDVNPTELEKKEVFPSKIEYPGVIFPLLAQKHLTAYAAEPAEPMFGEIVQSTIRAFDDFKKATPELSDALTRYNEATYALLAKRWQSPADAHDRTTALALEAKSVLTDALTGPVSAEGRRRWNEHIAEVAATATREHPGRRVLVLTGIENRGPVCALLSGRKDIELIDMEAWLRRHASAGTVAR